MRVRAAMVAMIGAWAVGAALRAHGATFTVSNTNDTGAGSLRQAVIDANATEESDEIKFSLPSGQAIVLLSPLEEVTDETLVFDATASSGLVIDGSSVEFLANDSSSTLQFKNLSYRNGTIDLRSGTTFTLDESASGVIADMLGDDITLIKTGTGTTSLVQGSMVDLKTGNSNSSDVRIEKGTFEVNGTLLTATVLVLPEGTFTVKATGTVAELKTFESRGTSVVNGTLEATSVLITQGTFTVANGATVRASTFQSGGTTAINGNLIGGTAATPTAMNRVIVNPQSAFTIGTGGIVTTKELDAKGTVVVNGTLEGSTSAPTLVTVEPQGTLTVGGTVKAGTVTVQSGGALAVNGGGTLSAATKVDALGPVTVNGTLSATGAPVNAQNAFTVNGTVSASSLVIGPSATLMGNGGTITAPVTIQGRMAPTTSTSPLTINGNLSFASTSVLDVDLHPDGINRVVSTGTVAVDGAQIVFRATPSEFSGTESIITVLRTSSSSLNPITGSFAPLTTDYAFLDERLISNSTSIQIGLKRNANTYADFAHTPNQAAVAQHLDAAPTHTMDDLEVALDAIENSQTAEIRPLLDAIGGESLTAFSTARQILGERTARALHRRARDLALGEGRAFYLAPREEPDVAAEGGEVPVERDPVRASVWLDGIGLFGELEGDTGEADVESLLYGGTLGGDAWIAEHVVVGLAAGYARSDVELDDREADVFGDTVQGALYGGFIDPRGYVSAYGRYAYTFQSSSRAIESSALSRHAHADWDAQDYGAGAEAGITVAVLGGFALQPIAGVDWLRLTEESYTESDAGSLGLAVDPETLDTTAARFGGRVFGRLDMGDAGALVPELRAFYQHLYGDRERVLEARLSGAPGLTSIGVRGAELPRENLILGVGWGVMLSQYLTVSFDYDAVLGSDRVEHQGNIAARVVF